MATDTELWSLSATELSKLISSKKASAVEITRSVLERLDTVNPAINAVVTEMPEEAISAAESIDKKISNKEPTGPLAGIPVTIKMNVDQIGHANTNGLQILKDNITDQDNAVVSNLRKAGAVFVGRTNTPAFSMRWFTRNTLHGHTRNPVNPDCCCRYWPDSTGQ